MPLLTLDQIESLCADALKRAGASDEQAANRRRRYRDFWGRDEKPAPLRARIQQPHPTPPDAYRHFEHLLTSPWPAALSDDPLRPNARADPGHPPLLGPRTQIQADPPRNQAPPPNQELSRTMN